MPTEFNAVMGFGVALFFAGGVYAVVTYAQASRLAMGMAALQNARLFFEQNRVRRNLFFGALAIASLGGLITCGSIMAGDANRNSQCDAACEHNGLQPGRFRGNPHVRFKPGDRYDCWCKSGDDWAKQPVNLGEPAAD